jgi:hypothetical protein
MDVVMLNVRIDHKKANQWKLLGLRMIRVGMATLSLTTWRGNCGEVDDLAD